jgi:hypothetical protein
VRLWFIGAGVGLLPSVAGLAPAEQDKLWGLNTFFSWLSEAILCGMLLPLGAGFYHPTFSPLDSRYLKGILIMKYQ